VTDPWALAELLLAHVRSVGMIDMHALAADPVLALERDPSVRIVWVEPARLPAGCSIAAAYDRNAEPARLLVSLDASPGRRRFSTLHEYGHHLRNQVPEVLEALFKAKDGGGEREERMCDEFAARVLLPDNLLDSALGPDVTARAVLNLVAVAPASAEACAVAAARRLPAPGYVILLARDAAATFTAHNRDVFHVRRGTTQPGLFIRAAAGQPTRGREQVRYGTGNLSQEMFMDAATANGRTAVVLVTDSPPWGGLTVGYKRGPDGCTAYCENCGRTFQTFAQACSTCGQAPCPECGHCGCESADSIAGERVCDRCFLLLPPAAYAARNSTTCKECS
jgi:hypothetical protein